jgi:hypothetical protein
MPAVSEGVRIDAQPMTGCRAALGTPTSVFPAGVGVGVHM